jgi:hypothetical protein
MSLSGSQRLEISEALGNDAWDEPDTGKPPCDFCRRIIPCECAGATCMCTCGRCQAPREGDEGA